MNGEFDFNAYPNNLGLIFELGARLEGHSQGFSHLSI